MSEHRRRRRQVLQQEEATAEQLAMTAPEQEATPEAAPETERLSEPETVSESETVSEPEIVPESEAGHESDAASARENANAKTMYACARTWAEKGLCAAKSAGIVLLGVLALLGSKIAVGADAAHRALHRRTGAMVKPARDIEHASAVMAEDLHGAAARRKQRDQLHREHIRWGLMTVCALVAVVSLVMMTRVIVRSIRTNMLNHQLAERRAQLIEKHDSSEEIEPSQPESTPEFVIFTGAEVEETGAENSGMEPAEELAELPAETTQTPEDVQEPEEKLAAPAVKRPIVKNTQYHVSSGTPLPHMAELYEQNRDLIGWLEIPEVLDLPVMYKDNSYYLKRDFNKQKNESGTLFLDENHRFSELTQNLLLHGHNMKDGTMFGRLLQYHTDIKYLKNNPFVNFDTLWKEEKYVIFAVLRVSLDVTDDAFFNYFSYPRFESDEEFNAYIRRLQLRSEYSIPLDVEPSDALLTLSTCLDDDRLVIVCRRFREGETRTQLRQIVHLATWQ